MKSDLSSSFEKPSFKQLLTRYEEMIRQHTSTYFESDELTLLAEYYASKKMVAESMEVLQYALSIHPDNLDVQLYICHTLVAEHKLDEAENILNSLSDQEDEEIGMLRATICIERHEFEKAESLFITIVNRIELTESVLTILDIADIYMDYNLDKQAYQWLKKAYKIEPDSAEVWHSLFDYHYTFGNLNKAIFYCNKLLDENAYEIDSWLNLTRCYIKQFKYREALDAIDFALAIDENHLTALELKGLCYIQLGDMKKGCELFSKIENSSPNRAQIYQIISECYLSAHDYDTAIEYLTKCLNLTNLSDFEHASLFQKRAFAYLHQGKLDLCKQDLDAGLSYDGQYDYLYLTLGEYYIQQGELEKAQREMTYAEALSSDKKEIKIEIANTYYHHNLFDEALAYYLKLEKDYSNFMPAYQYFIAYCYHRKNDRQNTIKYLVKAYRSSDYKNYEEWIQSVDKDGVFPLVMGEIRRLLQDESINPESFL